MSFTAKPRTIVIDSYRDAEGCPCCAGSFRAEDYAVCPLYRTKSFGQKELCAWNGVRLYRRGDGTGSLIPDRECPIWKDEPNETDHV